MKESGSSLSFLVTTSTDPSYGRRRPASAVSIINSHAAKSRWQQRTVVLGPTNPRTGHSCIGRSARQISFPAASSDQVKNVTSGRSNKQCVKALTSASRKGPSTDSNPDAQLEDNGLRHTQRSAPWLENELCLLTEPIPSMNTAVKLATYEKTLLHFCKDQLSLIGAELTKQI